jgi:diketogulonate reductase-like aldo/keto reductase
MNIKNIELNDKSHIPVLGFGTWELTGHEGKLAIQHALEVGYRHFDTADAYGNHEIVGEVIRESTIQRNDLFITSKVWRTDLEPEKIKSNAERFLDELQTDYLDLLLIHWPNDEVPVNESLDAMEQLRKDGLVNSIGVSNFTVEHLEAIREIDHLDISNNQVEIHPTLYQKELIQYCQDNNISVTAYSPLGNGNDLGHDELNEIAKKHEKPVSQVIINWLLSKGLIVLPRSSNRDHIEENFRATEWELDNEDIQKIDNLSEWNRYIEPGFAEFND